jgi:hypothetical protein
MANQLHIPAEDGTIIQVNAVELQSEEGKRWLAEELEKRRNDVKKDVEKAIK